MSRMSPEAPSIHDRVLVLMPTSVDAERTAALLAEAEIPSSVCAELAELCHELRAGAGAALVTDEALRSDTTGQLAEALRAQPTWSAVPVLVLVSAGMNLQHDRNSPTTARSMIMVERPVRMRTLLGMVQSALRARRHQYEIRDALLLREQQTAALIAQDERLRFALAAGGLGAWELDFASKVVVCSELCRAIFGLVSNDNISFDDLLGSIAEQDRARVLVALDQLLAHGYDFDVEYRVRWPNDELRWVMVRGRVAHQHEDGPQRIVGVALDITERKRLHEALEQSQSELARQAEQLRDADRRKDDFLATLAHELRNPLAPIRSGMELLSTVPSGEVAKHTVGVMQRQLHHMVRLIDDLLDVSRITQGKLQLKRAPVTLATVIESALETSRPLIEQRQHTLTVDLTREPLVFDADFTRLAQIISNLLNNASKYTAPEGRLQLSAHREGHEAVISVSDNGIGIPRDRLDDVFTLFSQVNRTLDRSQGGLGIGLALVRRLIEMHGGHVSAQSAGPGLGSTFTVRLPLAQVSAALEARPVQPVTKVVKQPSGKRILVVDDNDDAADLLSQILQHAGHETTVAHDGPSALQAAREQPPHIVFLDIGLPGMSGYDVARELRQDERFASVALVALTGWGTVDDQRRASEAGFDLHLTKPVDARTLQSTLERLTAGPAPAS